MKYTLPCKLYSAVLGKLLKKRFAARYEAAFAACAAGESRAIHRAIVLRSPDIGGRANPYISNLEMGSVFIAWYLAVRKTITPDEMEEVVTAALTGSPLVRFICSRDNQSSAKYRRRLDKSARWTQANAERYPETWVVKAEPHSGEHTTAFTISRCALLELCRREGCPEFTPILCGMDFTKARLGKADLTRQGTLADGVTLCDFLYTRKSK